MKDSFILYTENLEQVEMLDMEQRGYLLTAIMYYAAGKELPDMDGMVKMAFSIIRKRIDVNAEKYDEICRKRAEAGKRGGRPKNDDASASCQQDKKAKKANGFSEKQKKQMVFSESKQKQKNPDTESDTDTEPDPDIYLKDVCPEPETAPDPPAGKFLLNDGTFFEITENDVVKYQQLYPGIDVRQQLRNIEGWCDANPTRRKTRNGAKRFLNNWLSTEQNNGSKLPGSSLKQYQPKQNRFNNFHQREYDYSQLEKDLQKKQMKEMEGHQNEAGS